MFGAYQTCNGIARDSLVRVRRQDFTQELLREIPRLYYKDVKQRYILEKNRAWTHDPLGFRGYLSERPRIVVLLRRVPEIVQSFVHVAAKNGDVLPERNLLVNDVDPFMDALQNTMKALQSGDDTYLFGTYDQLVRNPQHFVEAVYRHYGWEPYAHDYDHVEDLHLEDDAAENTQGLHDIRPVVERRNLTTRVSLGLMNKAKDYDDVLWEQVRISLRETPHRHI